MRSNRRVVGAGLVGGFVAGGLVFGGAPVWAERTAVDLTFGVNGTATVPPSPVFASGGGYGNGREVAATADGRVYLAGRAGADFSYVGSAVTRFRSDGTLDTAFGDEGSVVLNLGDDTRVMDVDASADGGLLLLVSDIIPEANGEFGLIRLLPNGSFDPDYGSAGVFTLLGPFGEGLYSVGDMAVADDGTALVVGSGFGYGNGDDVVVKVTPAGESAAFGQYGWFQFPSEWVGYQDAKVEVDSQGRVLILDGAYGVIHRLSPLGVLDSTLPEQYAYGDDFRVTADDGFQTFGLTGSEDGCAYLGVESFDEVGATAGPQGSIRLGCDSKREQLLEVVSAGADAFVLTQLDNGLSVRRFGQSGQLSVGFGIGGVAKLPSGFNVPETAGSLAVDGSGRPVVAFKDDPTPPLVSALRVTRFARSHVRPIDVPADELTGGAYRQGSSLVFDPVDTATGNLTDSWVDLAGEAFGLTFTRSYNGLSSLSSALGQRWLAATGPSVFADGGGVSMVMPEGARYRFLPDGSGGYQQADGVAGVLAVDAAATPSGGGSLPMLKLSYNDGSVDRFDTEGRLVSQAAWDGQTALSTYGPHGVVSVTASTGQSLSMDYDGSGRLSQVSTSSGRSVTYSYDAQGWLSSIVDEYGAVWTVTYTAEGWLKTLTDPSGVVLEDNTYDSQGRVIEQLLPPNSRVTFSFDDAAAQTSVTEWAFYYGSWYQITQVLFAHDTEGKVVAIYDDTADLSALKTYDEAGNLVANKTRGDLEESATYDADYNLTSVTDPATGTTSYTYDSANRVLTVTSPSGATTTYTYDGAERSPATVTDELGNTTSYNIVSGLVMSQTDADGVTTTNTYDTQRRLTSTSDEYGNTTTRSYDAQGRLTQTVTAQGRTTTWTYNTAGRLASATAPDGGITSYTYDPAGRVLTVTDPVGAVTTNSYDTAGNLVTVTDPGGNVTTYGYDYAGRRISTLRPDSVTSENLARDHLGRLLSEYSVLGNYSESVYAADGQIESTLSSPVGGQTLNGFDTAGRQVSTTDEAGRVSTSTFDSVGRVASTITPGGATTTYGYDELGRQSTVTDARGADSTTVYTPGGRVESMTDAAALTTTYGYDLAGRQVTVTAPGDRTTTTVYDGDGQVTSTTSPGGLVTAYAYDQAGRVATVTDPAGVVATRTYTLRGELATEKVGAQGTVSYTYNPTGTMASVTDANGATTTFTYDGRGNMLTRTNALGGVDTWVYNQADQVVTATDPLGRVTTMSYDEGGQLTSMTDPSGRTVALTYNPDGTPNTQTTGVGDTTYTYDPAGRVASVTDTTGTMTYTYNTAGDLTSMTTPSGATTQLEYDQAGRRSAMRHPDGRGVDYSYNPAGELASITQSELLIDRFAQPDGAIPASVNWTRTVTTGASAVVQGGAVVLGVPNTTSAAARLTSKVAARLDSDVTFQYRFSSVDATNKGRLVTYARLSSTGHYRVEIDAGATTGNVYKRVGSTTTTLGTFPVTAGTTPQHLRLTVVGSTVNVTAWDATTTEPATPTASFTSSGVTTAGTSRVDLTRVTGTSTLSVDNWIQTDPTTPRVLAGYSYNSDGQIVNEALIGGTRSYVYLNGRRTGFSETLPGASRSTTLTYDTTGRIATETTGTITTTYGYDPASQLLSVTPTTGSATVYTYDPLGRRSTEKIGTAAATRYVYDAAGQLCWTTTRTLPATPSCASPLPSAATFAWDPAGRLTNETRTATNKVDYTYDPAGRLDTITRLNGTTTTTQTRSYTPDGLLNQTTNTVGAAITTSTYAWDPTIGQVPQLSAITNTAGVVSNLTYGATGWASVHTSAVLNPVAIATDVHGSVIPSTGNTLARNVTYTANGTPAGTNTFEPRLGYRGELTLDNQLWLRARTYQPTIGRFTTRDPAPGRPGATTLADPYHYADNNPLNRIDPAGTFTQPVVHGLRPGVSTALGSDPQAAAAGFPFQMFSAWHRAVQDDLALTVGGKTEWQCRIPGAGPNGGIGRADVCTTTHIWEVKYFGEQGLDLAIAQLRRYREIDNRELGFWVKPSLVTSGADRLLAFSTDNLGVRLYIPIPRLHVIQRSPVRLPQLEKYVAEEDLIELLVEAGLIPDFNDGWDLDFPSFDPPSWVPGGAVGGAIAFCVFFCIPTPWPVL